VGERSEISNFLREDVERVGRMFFEDLDGVKDGEVFNLKKW
jgi:DNA-binding protein Fis